MHRFEVWSPAASQMAVSVKSVSRPMYGPDEQGWWHLEVEDAGPGTDYGFIIDNQDGPFPDPRSQYQPGGVNALSRVYDHSAFEWTDARFQSPPFSGGVVYELHIGTFTFEGTLDSAIAKLDHLVDLGVTHVELMPVAAFAGNHGWGYDGVALFAVHQPYGGPDALKRFVDAAHAKGLAVLLDVVYNHFGPSGNYTGKFGPYLTDAHHTPWGGAVNLEDTWAFQVRRFFIDNAMMWMRDFHIDGLRLDAVHAYADRSAIHFLEQLATETDALEASVGRSLILIAESDLNDPRVVTAREANGYGIDAQWSDDFHHALFSVVSRKPPEGYYTDFGSLEQLVKALEETFVYDGIYSKYRKRVHGKPATHLSQHRFLGYIQDHDQIGNRAVGDRLEHEVGFERAKIAAAIVIMSPFIPMLFQGEEWAASSPFQYFADHEDPELARLVSEGRKKEFEAFGWGPASIPDPEKKETFERSKLRWNEVNEKQHQEMLKWYRDLIQLRRSTAALNVGEHGHTKVSHDARAMWLSIRRGEIEVFCNLGNDDKSFEVAAKRRVILSSRADIRISGGELKLPPNTIVITKGTSDLNDPEP